MILDMRVGKKTTYSCKLGADLLGLLYKVCSEHVLGALGVDVPICCV